MVAETHACNSTSFGKNNLFNNDVHTKKHIIFSCNSFWQKTGYNSFVRDLS